MLDPTQRRLRAGEVQKFDNFGVGSLLSVCEVKTHTETDVLLPYSGATDFEEAWVGYEHDWVVDNSIYTHLDIFPFQMPKHWPEMGVHNATSITAVEVSFRWPWLPKRWKLEHTVDMLTWNEVATNVPVHATEKIEFSPRAPGWFRLTAISPRKHSYQPDWPPQEIHAQLIDVRFYGTLPADQKVLEQLAIGRDITVWGNTGETNIRNETVRDIEYQVAYMR